MKIKSEKDNYVNFSLRRVTAHFTPSEIKTLTAARDLIKELVDYDEYLEADNCFGFCVDCLNSIVNDSNDEGEYLFLHVVDWN